MGISRRVIWTQGSESTHLLLLESGHPFLLGESIDISSDDETDEVEEWNCFNGLVSGILTIDLCRNSGITYPKRARARTSERRPKPTGW